MKKNQKRIFFSLLFAVLFMFGMAQTAMAVGTASGTNVTNLATIAYDVGGSPQTAIESSPAGNSTPGAGNGTSTDFLVDNMVDLTVAELSGAYTDVVPNSTVQVLAFTVSNTGNTTQDFSLAQASQAGGLDPFGGTDNFDATNINIYVDRNDNTTYEAGTDTATYIDELAADGSVTVFIVVSIPVTQISGDISAHILTATAHDGSGAGALGAATVQTAGADTPGAVDVVFADGMGDTDAARDGLFSDTDAYRVLAAQLSVAKTSAVIRDPFNLNTNPKHIPGAYVQYTVTITNAAGANASATLTTITDTLDGNMAIDPDLIVGATGVAENAAGDGFKVTHSGGSRALASPSYYTTTSSVDGVDHDGSATGGTVTATMATVLPAEAGYTVGELKPGESVTLTFNVIIQ